MEKKENGSNEKKFSMRKSILVSVILSLAVNLAYLAVETICVMTGRNMPFQRVAYGGECIEYCGIFWRITAFAPLTRADEPHAPSPNIEYLSVISLFMAILGLAFLFWCLLCLFKKRLKPVLITAGGMAAVMLAVVGCKQLKSAWDDAPVELYKIMVITSDIHEGNYFSLCYPADASYLVAPGEDGAYGKTAYDLMTNYTQPQAVTRKQLKALLQAARKVKDASDSDMKKDFMYFIKVTYKTNEGYGNVRAYGYGAFPEEWAEFIRLTNEICGQDYLREQPEPAILTAKWFSETYGLWDEDLPEGASVEHFLSSQKVQMKNVCGLSDSGNYIHYSPSQLILHYLSLFQ